MKVLHILGELNPSGAEVMLYSAGPILKDHGIAGEILSIGAQQGRYSEQLSGAGYKIHHLPFSKSPFFFITLFRLFKSNSYDVIHLHTERANFWLGLLARTMAKRSIRTIHSNFPFTGFLGWKRKWQRQLLSRLGVIHIAISDSVRGTELKYFNLQTSLIPNWYNSVRFKPVTQLQRIVARESLNLTSDQFVLVTVGNCAAIKNHTALIRALAQIQCGNIIYLHIGIEKDNSERALALELGISDKILFQGMQTDILPFLYAADLYVMPSTHEGCPISAIEAIASGLPVLFSDVPGLADFSEIFKGLFYCKPTSESIAVALEEIIAFEPDRLIENCSSNAEQAEYRFGINRGLLAYLELYNY